MFEFSARKLTPTNFEWKPQFKLYRYHLCCNLIPNNSHIQKMIIKISPTFWSSNYNSGAQQINDQIYSKNSSDLVPICPYVILFLEKKCSCSRVHDIFNPHETKTGSGFGIKFIIDNIAVMNSIESGSYPAYTWNIFVIVQEKCIFWLNSKRLEINEYLIWKRKKNRNI